MTGGRLAAIRPYLTPGEPFCFTYGDGVADIDIGALIAFHRATARRRRSPRSRRPGGSARWRSTAIGSPASGEAGRGRRRINGGFFVADPSVLDRVAGPETIWEREPLEAPGRRTANCWPTGTTASGTPMDTLRDKLLLEELWAGGAAPWKLW